MQFKPTLHKLSNGLTVILDPMDVATDEVCICFRTGSADEEPHEYGLTHFCEHMFCNGTPRFPNNRTAHDYIADNGGVFNAVTSCDFLRFTGRIISQNLWTLLDFWADRLENSLFDADKIETERGVILDELGRSLSKSLVQQTIFTEKKLYNIDVKNGKMTLGTPENIKSFTRQNMLDFASKRMSGKNCLICISGKIDDTDELLHKLESRFNFLPNHDVARKGHWHYQPCTAHHVMPELKNDVITILFPDLWTDTIENEYKNLCVGKFKRCLQEHMIDTLRSKYGLVYGAGFSNHGDIFESVSGPYAETAPKNVSRVVELMARISHEVYISGPSETDLRKYRNQNRLGRANVMESNAQRCNKLVFDWGYYDCLRDVQNTWRLSDSATVSDVMKNTRGMFDGPMSIITHGQEFDGDLEQVWKENFK